jgi:hypothetical protein
MIVAVKTRPSPHVLVNCDDHGLVTLTRLLTSAVAEAVAHQDRGCLGQAVVLHEHRRYWAVYLCERTSLRRIGEADDAGAARELAAAAVLC